jgi:hypothetical protein
MAGELLVPKADVEFPVLPSTVAVFTCWVPPSGQIRLNPFGYTPVCEQILLSLPLPTCVETPGYEFSRETKPVLSLPVTLPGLARYLLWLQ